MQIPANMVTGDNDYDDDAYDDVDDIDDDDGYGGDDEAVGADSDGNSGAGACSRYKHKCRIWQHHPHHALQQRHDDASNAFYIQIELYNATTPV